MPPFLPHELYQQQMELKQQIKKVKNVTQRKKHLGRPDTEIKNTKMQVRYEESEMSDFNSSSHKSVEKLQHPEFKIVVANDVAPGKYRGYSFNPETKQYERVIRKRKRKTGDQLKYLYDEFNANPHWSKQTLYDISRRTGLTEAQVYKWGWDQKRKQFGVEEAERMCAYENHLNEQLKLKQNGYKSAKLDTEAASGFSLPQIDKHQDMLKNRMKSI